MAGIELLDSVAVLRLDVAFREEYNIGMLQF
jgi:hypothetical protein